MKELVERVCPPGCFMCVMNSVYAINYTFYQVVIIIIIIIIIIVIIIIVIIIVVVVIYYYPYFL